MSGSKLLVVPIVVALLAEGLSAPAAAELCVIDAVPAATILVPYFEVDFRNAGKGKFENTRVTLINTAQFPVIAHVILWTDLSVPTLNFDIPLTGFDVQEFDVDLLFTQGVLPIPSGSSPAGSSCSSCSSDGCVNISPANDFTLSDLRRAHLGDPVSFYDGQCLGRSMGGGNVARGYITVDVVSECTRLYPSDGGYFVNGGNGVATNDNVLKATITTFSNKFLREVPAIHIEAGTSDGLSTDGNFTFYGRYRDFDASDNRECGAFAWAMPFKRQNKFKTEAIVWRDSGFAQGPFDCDDGPSGFPLETAQLLAFDDQENVIELSGTPFPAETQLVDIGKNPYNTSPFKTGWISFSLANETDDEFTAGHGYVIARQRFKSREGDAWAEHFQTVCGESVPAALRTKARRSISGPAGGDVKGEARRRLRALGKASAKDSRRKKDGFRGISQRPPSGEPK